MRLEMAGADLIRELAWKERQSFMERGARKTPNAWYSLSLSYRTLFKVEARRSNALEPTGSVGIYRTMFFNKVKYLPLLRSKY